MFSPKTITLLVACFAACAVTMPIRREVPQEHSHEPFLTSVRKSLLLSNPDQIQDPVFGLLGNAAASVGQGKITDTDCLQQATADQAFTNAKAAKDIDGMVNALLYRAVERNTGKVGLASVLCTSIKAKNPEIAAITQHQDPASPQAATINKGITLELAKQIKAVGGDPQLALKAGTFKPGNLNDATGKGNTCDDANDPNGCIFTQKLLVEDATAAEINAAVAGTGAGTGAAAPNNANDGGAVVASPAPAAAAAATGTCPPAATVTVTVGAAATPAVAAATPPAPASPGNAAPPPAPVAGGAPSNAATGAAVGTGAAAGGNLQKFTGALGGIAAPAVRAGGRGFQVDNNSDFLNVAAALGRSCDVQHNQCANAANSKKGVDSVSACDAQNDDCRKLIGA